MLGIANCKLTRTLRIEMKKLLAVLLATTTLSFAVLPQAYAQALTAAQFAGLDAEARAVYLAGLGLTQEQIAKLLTLASADLEKLIALPAAELINVASLPAAELQVVAALPAAQIQAVGSLPAAQLQAVAALPAAQRTEIFTAVTELKTAATAGNAGAIAADVGRLNVALAALPATARANFAVAVGQDLQASVATLPADSAVRGVVSSAIGGVAQIVVANGGSEDQLQVLTVAAVDALQTAPAGPAIGAITQNPQASGV